jgi:hypothetical protein
MGKSKVSGLHNTAYFSITSYTLNAATREKGVDEKLNDVII